MSDINYDNRYFIPKVNSANGEVNADTLFHYRQHGRVVWATYEGGEVQFGTLLARAEDDGSLDMRYSHINSDGELMTGHCRTVPEVLADGRLRLHERWRWTSGDGSEGQSILEESKPPDQL